MEVKRGAKARADVQEPDPSHTAPHELACDKKRAEGFEAAFFTGAMESIQQHNGKPVTKAESRQTVDFGCGIVIGEGEHKLTWANLDRYRRNAWLDYNRTVDQLRRLQRDRIDEPVRELIAAKHHDDYMRRRPRPQQGPFLQAGRSQRLCLQRKWLRFAAAERPYLTRANPERRSGKSANLQCATLWTR